MENTATLNKMGTVPVKKLLLTMGLPMIVSMALQAFYNIVDSYFVSGMPGADGLPNAGECGLAALTLAFPVQMLMIAVGVGTGVGVNALLSRSLGQGDREKAGRIAGNAIFLGLCTYAAFLLVGLFGVGAYLRSQTNDPDILQMGGEYLGICAVFSFGAILSMIYEKLLQGTGRTVVSTCGQLAGAAANIVLDPIMIFGLLGCPALGIAGAAYATVIGQTVTFAVYALFYHIRNKDLDTRFSRLKPDGAAIAEIYKIGVPAILMQALMSFTAYGANLILGRVSPAAVTAYGTYYKIQQFVFFAAFGMNNALIPIAAFNYGMRDRRRVNETIRYGMAYTLAIMILGAILLQALAKPLMGLFSLSDATLALCVAAIRVITVGYPFAGANITYQGVFQAFGKGVRSLAVSALRLVVVALPAAFLLTLSSRAETVVWWAFPIAEGFALAAAVFLFRRLKKERIDRGMTNDGGGQMTEGGQMTNDK
ncbi:MAG: MATE family efflux transporter [Clostridiales bacterium]|jgi:putative MATE family efflux protein|nr:MATE family efflux transporter [Clostridiales bacterium]